MADKNGENINKVIKKFVCGKKVICIDCKKEAIKCAILDRICLEEENSSKQMHLEQNSTT